MNMTPRVFFGETPCVNIHFANSIGFSPDVGYVEILTRDDQQIIINQPIGDIRPLGRESFVSAKPPSNWEVINKNNINLEPWDYLYLWDGVNPPITIGFVFISKEGVEVVDRSEKDGHKLWRINITDVRMFWQDRGIVFGNYNCNEIYGEADIYELINKCCRALTGYNALYISQLDTTEPALKFPAKKKYSTSASEASTVYPRSIFPETRWGGGMLASEALKKICDKYQIYPCLIEGFYLSFYTLDEGFEEFTPEKFSIQKDKKNLGWSYGYSSVWINSTARVIREFVNTQFEPVLTADKDYPDLKLKKGDYWNLYSALKYWGINFLDFQKQILKTERALDRHNEKDLPEYDIRRKIISEQGFKWFRIKGNPLPMEQHLRVYFKNNINEFINIPIKIQATTFQKKYTKNPNENMFTNILNCFEGEQMPLIDYQNGVLKFKSLVGLLIPDTDIVYDSKTKELEEWYKAEADKLVKSMIIDNVLIGKYINGTKYLPVELQVLPFEQLLYTDITRVREAVKKINEFKTDDDTVVNSKKDLISKINILLSEYEAKIEALQTEYIQKSQNLVTNNLEEMKLLEPIIKCIYAAKTDEYFTYKSGSSKKAKHIVVDWELYTGIGGEFNDNYKKSNEDNLIREAQKMVSKIIAVPEVPSRNEWLINGFIHYETSGKINSIAWDSDGNSCQTTIIKNIVVKHPHFGVKKND